MCHININIPNEVMYDTKMNSEQTLDFVRKAVAIRYYTNEGVSLGYCAEIAGMTKEDFIKFLGMNNVSIFQFDSEDEFLEDITNA
ncbi:MAG: UPF0175 family protein [Clostridiales bacterium]|nr:UPF0175 family protein [Clostridiales bacterium]